MNRLLLTGLLLCFLLFPAPRARAADAAAIAEQQEREERYKQLRNDFEEMMTTQAVLQKRIQTLADEIKTLRDEKNRPPPDLVTREDLKILAAKIEEVDKKREADNQKILAEIEKLAKTPAPPEPAAKAAPKSAAIGTPPGGATDRGYEYEVQPGDNLSTIVQAYRKAGVKVTVEQVMKANPRLNDKKLLVGQKVFIPGP